MRALRFAYALGAICLTGAGVLAILIEDYWGAVIAFGFLGLSTIPLLFIDTL